MAKARIKYICTSCGFESPKWIGKCPECEGWNTFTEEIVESGKKSQAKRPGSGNIYRINEVVAGEEERIKTSIKEFDRVVGGGIVPGSVILLAGDPGIGKSTLAMQVAANLTSTVLYVTGEESVKQVKLRALRLKVKSENFLIQSETNLNNILAAVNETSPSVLIIDSIQTIQLDEFDNSAGTVTQIRECTTAIMEQAKKKHFAVIIIGHVTKEGNIAGPKVLEHIVDTVLQFEGESNYAFRILRALKNRFGSTNEIGIFEMNETGLTEVNNPSEHFLSGRKQNISGSVITSSIEGSRSILIEVQALVIPSPYGIPQRVTTGFDSRRLSILLAVLEKRAGLKLSSANVFLNLAGGVKITEPSIDLSICCSVASAFLDKVIDNNTVITGEVGLGGEVRSVRFIEKRIKEAEKLGFSNIIIPEENYKKLNPVSEINIIPVKTLPETIRHILK